MIELRTNEFLNVEKKELLKKVTIYIGKKIEQIKIEKRYNYNEIARTLKVQNARLSEWIHYHNYDQNISEKDLSKCVEEKIVTVNELIKNCADTEKEKDYLNEFKMYENRPLKDLLGECEKAGMDIMSVLKKELNKLSDK